MTYRNLPKKLLTALLISMSALTFTACATPNQTTAVEQYNPTQFAKIIDVRSEEEYNQEHLDGATRISINEDTFETQINQLDKKADYYLYSRSASRPAEAIQIMKANGFTGKLVNGGEIHTASRQLGIEAVKPFEENPQKPTIHTSK